VNKNESVYIILIFTFLIRICALFMLRLSTGEQRHAGFSRHRPSVLRRFEFKVLLHISEKSTQCDNSTQFMHSSVLSHILCVEKEQAVLIARNLFK
jgi:hypothetical protein